MASLNLGESVRTALKPAQEGLFALLGGILAEQRETNELLRELVERTVVPFHEPITSSRVPYRDKD